MAKLTAEEVQKIVDEEGVGNALAMIEASDIEDQELAKRWAAADDAVTIVEQRLTELEE